MTPFVDSGPTTNQQSVRSTNFVDVDDFSSNQHSWWSTNFVDLLLTQNQQYLSTGQTWPSRLRDWLLIKSIFWTVKWISWVPDPKAGVPKSSDQIHDHHNEIDYLLLRSTSSKNSISPASSYWRRRKCWSSGARIHGQRPSTVLLLQARLANSCDLDLNHCLWSKSPFF